MGQAVPAALVLLGAGLGGGGRAAFRAPGYPIRLHPNEWQSGDVFWIIDCRGRAKAVQQCIEALTKTAFQGKQFKAMHSAVRKVRDNAKEVTDVKC